MPFINRELSWLEFNQRVLEEAKRPTVPLLERLKFLAITASNLDEFFQVRVGGLSVLRRSGTRKPDIAGLSPAQQISMIRKRVLAFVDDQYELLSQDLLPALRAQGIKILELNELSHSQDLQVSTYFSELIFPILTPLAVDTDGPAPSLPSLVLLIVCRLKAKDDHASRYAFVPIPENLPRFIAVQSNVGDCFVRIEDVVRRQLAELFPGESVSASAPFRITRNSDIEVQEEDAVDLAGEMEDVLAARRVGDVMGRLGGLDSLLFA